MVACERCPSPGACGAVCPLLRRLQTIEFGKAKVSVVQGIEELFSKKSPGLREGTFIFNAIREPLMRIKEKICSICKEAASTCGHSKSKTSALAAA